MLKGVEAVSDCSGLTALIVEAATVSDMTLVHGWEIFSRVLKMILVADGIDRTMRIASNAQLIYIESVGRKIVGDHRGKWVSVLEVWYNSASSSSPSIGRDHLVRVAY